MQYLCNVDSYCIFPSKLEGEEETLVSSGSAEKQNTDLESSSSDNGKNGSGSSSSVSKKAVCSELNITQDAVKDVEVRTC